MFDFFYNKMTKNTPCEFEMGMSDTDSFLFRVTKPDLFWKHVNQWMDFSNYPTDHTKFNNNNKAKLGFFKDELCGNQICKGFIGLRPKCYALKLKSKDTLTSSEKKVCKGLGRVAIKNRLRYSEYQQCLTNRKIIRHHYASIRSQKHNLKTIVQHKKALTYFDAKRYLFSCGIHSAPYGSELILLFQDTCPFCKKK
jgi:hypothetical protein